MVDGLLTTTNLIFSVGLIIIIATIVAFLARLLRQPLIPAYILTGVILGPIGFGLIKDIEIIKALSEIGIAFLLFIVGLEMKLEKLKEVSLISVVGGVVQVILTFFLGFYVALRLGFLELEAIYIGLILAFSSTMVVIKLLSDKEKLGTLHGRIILGILLVQDVIVIFILSFLFSLNNLSVDILSGALIKGFILFAVAIFISKFLLKPVFRFAARSQELLFLASITMLFLFSLFAYFMNFSIAVGAFIAGVGLATLPYNFDVIGRVRPLKDFFATIFFVSLGMELFFDNFQFLLQPLLYLLLIVILFKPFIIMLISSLFGYEKRTSFLSAASLGQISEFSLIIVAMGVLFGHIGQAIFSLTVLIAVISIILTSYFIHHEDSIYSGLAGILSIFEGISLGEQKLEYVSREGKKNIVLFGCHRMGAIFLETLRKLDKNVLVVDNDPEVIKALIKEKISCIYGDVTNLEILNRLELGKAKIVVSTIPAEEDNLFLLRYVKVVNPKAVVFVSAHHLHTAVEMYEAEADYVILPHILSGEMIADLLRKVTRSKRELISIRNKHIKHLFGLKHFGHDHIFATRTKKEEK